MAYTPTVWAHDTAVTDTLLDHAETQYDEGYNYYAAHTHDSDYYIKTDMESGVSGFWYAGNDGTGSGCDGDKIYTSSGNLDYGSLSIAGAPVGVICLWSGSVASIPNAEGWYLCDGNNGTIDLTDKWVIGAGTTYAVGATGGSTTCVSADSLSVASHTVSIAEMPSHRHAWTDYYPTITAWQTDYDYHCHGSTPIYHYGVTAATGTGNGHTHTGTCTTTGTENRPQSKAYAYMQKIS